MLTNHLKTALRFIQNNRLLSVLNIAGLAIGIALFIVLGLFANHEFSYDKFHNKSDRIYRLLQAKVEEGTESLEEEDFRGSVFGPVGTEIENSMPMVSNYVRFINGGKRLVKYQDKTFQETSIFITDPSVSEVFDLNLLSGGVSGEPLNLGKSTVYISKSAALKIFETVEAQNKVIELETLGDFIVGGVFEDLPGNSHLDFDYLLSIEWADDVVAGGFFKSRGKKVLEYSFPFPVLNTYVLFDQPVTDHNIIEDQIASLVNPNLQSEHAYKLQELEDIYLSEIHPQTAFKPAGNRTQANLFLYLSFGILIIAIINYTNLTTAKHVKRVKVLGIRRTLGGTRANLIYQLLFESLLLVSLAFIFGICMAEIILPTFNAYTGKGISVPYNNIEFYLYAGGFVVSLALVNGIYPAYFLTKVSPLEGISGRNTSNDKSFVRQSLLVVQFMCAMGLIFATTMVKSQFDYLRQKDLGIDTEQLVRLPLQGDNLKKNYEGFKAQLLTSPYINQVTGSDYRMLDMVPVFQQDHEDYDEQVPMATLMVKSNFLQTVGAEFVEGQDQYLDHPEDDNWFYVNEEFIRVFGKKENGAPNVSNAIMEDIRFGGVVKDFHYVSTNRKIDPLLITLSNSENTLESYIKISESNPSEALKHIQRSFNEFTSDHPFEYTFLDEDFASRFESEQRLANVFNIFTSAAVLVAALGLYGLAAFMAEQRTKELGIRQVLGATWQNIGWLLGKNTIVLILVSMLVSLPLAYLLMNQWLSEYPYHVAVSAAHLMTSPLFVMLLALGIVFGRTRKVTSISAVESLRQE